MELKIDLDKCTKTELKAVIAIMHGQAGEEQTDSEPQVVEVTPKIGRPNGSRNRTKKRGVWKTEELEELVTLMKSGRNTKSIGRALQRTTAAVSNMLYRLEKRERLTKTQKKFVKKYL